MNSTCARLAGILSLVAAPHAHAQGVDPRGFLVGVGGGASLVNEPAAGLSHFGAAVHLRAGWSLGPSTAVMLEASMNALGSRVADSVQVNDPGFGPYFDHFSRSLQTESLLASLQLGSPASFYVRPGVGIARHGFRVLRPISNDEIIEAMEWEIAPAAALTAGRAIPIPGFPLNVEGVVGWSGGEDSTNPRWTAGVQIARVFQF